MTLGALISRMIAAGVSAEEAGALAAEIYALGVASASVRSPGAERTRRWREKKASHCDGFRHQTSRGDASTEASQNVTERHKPSQCDADAVSNIDTTIKNTSKQNSARASRGTRIADDWAPSPVEREFAKLEGLADSEINREAARFLDYWKSKAGSNGVKLNWTATWQNWIRTAAERLGRSPRAPAANQSGSSMFHAKFGSEELDAWDAYTRNRTGKPLPRDKTGGWSVPARWPPGYKPASGPSHDLKLSTRTMQ